MRTEHGMVEGNIEIDDHVTMHGMFTGHVTVNPGGFLVLHGIANRDLLVRCGGAAKVHGMVNGSLISEGGKVDV